MGLYFFNEVMEQAIKNPKSITNWGFLEDRR